MSSRVPAPPSEEFPEGTPRSGGIIPPSGCIFLPAPLRPTQGGGAGPRGSQDGLSDDADEAVGPLSLCSRGSPLGSGPPRRDEGA